MKKKIAVLGSTGSIGTQTLDVVQHADEIDVFALSTNTNIELLEQQVKQFHPTLVCVMDEKKAHEFSKQIGRETEVVTGLDGLVSVATLADVDMVVNALVGNVGLTPTLEAIRAKKNIALANKETLVTAGEIVMREVQAQNVALYPVDSEHSAIFQCLQGNAHNRINKIYLTASGGPFRTWEDLSAVTLEAALKHPNWEMGKKITIDSATMMNKGLEVIEAKWLFGVSLTDIDVLVHPQSIVHSMVEFEDGAVMAQLGTPDMRTPIQYAIQYPNRPPNDFPRLNLLANHTLTFEKPRMDVFRCLQLAFDAIQIGGTMPAVLNAANEVAVEFFLNREISFLDIPRLIESAMDAYTVIQHYELRDVLEADRWAREFVSNKQRI